MRTRIAFGLTFILILTSAHGISAWADNPRSPGRDFDGRDRADPGSPVSRLPFRFGPQGEARPLEESLGPGRRQERAGDRAGQARRKPALGAGRVGRDAPQGTASRDREGGAAGVDRRRGELGHRSDRSLPGDDQPPGRPRLVVAPAGSPAAAADGRRRGLGANADRCVCAQEAGSQWAGAGTRSRKTAAHSPPELRS